MAGRPKNPTSWASGNYGAGANAWNGTVKRVANSGRYFEPKQLASPQEMNDAIGEMIDNDTTIINAFGQGPALNWPTIDSVTGGSSPSLNGIAWDPKFGRWMVFGVKPATTNAALCYVSSNGGRTWVFQGGQNPSTGTPDCSIQGVIYNPTTGKLAVCTYPGVGPGDVGAITDEEARVALSHANAKVAGIAYNGLYIFAGNADTTTLFLKTSPLGSNVWTSRLPVTGVTAASWCDGNPFALASSGSAVMGVKLGRTNYSEYIYSTNGTAWTKKDHTATASWFNVGLCWSVDRWVIMQTNGTDSRVLVSTDGTNWSTASTLTATRAGGLAAVGALLFASTYANLDIHGAWSTDGGVTWQFGGSYGVTPASAGVPDRVHSNGSQFVTVSDSKVCFSLGMGVPGTQGF